MQVANAKLHNGKENSCNYYEKKLIGFEKRVIFFRYKKAH